MKQLLIGSSERLLCFAEVAENAWTRGRGLLGRKGLPEGRGLWIRPCKSVHTCFMGFPIDLAYLAADGTVVKTCSRLQPFRFSAGGRRAHSVLELPAGSLDQMQVVVGEKLSVSPVATKTSDVELTRAGR